jgi:hypothetical protein
MFENIANGDIWGVPFGECHQGSAIEVMFRYSAFLRKYRVLTALKNTFNLLKLVIMVKPLASRGLMTFCKMSGVRKN